jgi:membrane-bound serine protease (ClpP class)
MVLLGLEAMAAGIGVLGVGAVVSFVIGGLLLFHSFGPTSPTLPDVRVNIWLILGTAVLLLGGGGWFVMTMVKSRQTDNPSTSDAVIGEVGMVTSDLAPIGMVQLPSGLWSAIADNDEVIMTGERVRVVSMEGLTVNVQKAR